MARSRLACSADAAGIMASSSSCANVDAAVATRSPSSYGATAASATKRASSSLSACWCTTPSTLVTWTGPPKRNTSCPRRNAAGGEPQRWTGTAAAIATTLTISAHTHAAAVDVTMPWSPQPSRIDSTMPAACTTETAMSTTFARSNRPLPCSTETHVFVKPTSVNTIAPAEIANAAPGRTPGETRRNASTGSRSAGITSAHSSPSTR